VTLTVRADSIDEVGIEVVESGIQLRFEAQYGDKFYVELDDEVLGHVIAHLMHYAWDITLEDYFAT